MRWVGKENLIFSLGLWRSRVIMKLNVLYYETERVVSCKNTVSVLHCYSNWIRIRILALAFFKIWTLQRYKIICPEADSDHLMMREMPWRKATRMTRPIRSTTVRWNMRIQPTSTSKQGFESVFIWYGYGSSILGSNPNPNPDPIRIQGFYDQKLKKITAGKKMLSKTTT